MNNISSTPRQKVIFYPFKYHFGDSAKKHIMDVLEIDATSSVYSLSVSGQKSSPSSTFSITLVPDQNWPRRLRPGDWVAIFASQFEMNTKENPTRGLRCLGTIDRISKQSSVNAEGRRVTVYQIVGRSFGKFFEKIKFYYDPYLPEEVTKNYYLLNTGFDKFDGTPDQFLKNYINLYLGDGKRIATETPTTSNNAVKKKKAVIKEKKNEIDQIRIPDPIYKLFGVVKSSGRLKDILKIKIGEGALAPEGFTFNIAPEKLINNNFWEILNKISNPLINELFVSLESASDGKIYPTITLRKIPFTGSEKASENESKTYNFTKVNYLTIPDSMIIREDLGFSDHEIFSYINFNANYPNATNNNFFPYMHISKAKRQTILNGVVTQVPLFPFIDEVAIKRYGFTSFESSTEFCMSNKDSPSLTSGQDSPDLKLAESWMKYLIDCWSHVGRTENGTIFLKGFSKNMFFNVTADPTSFLLSKASSLVSNFSVPTPPKPSFSLGFKPDLGNIGSSLPKPESIPASDHFDVGCNVYCKDKLRLYHLEGYSLEWTTPKKINISFTLTRGVYWDEESGKKSFRFIDDHDYEGGFSQKETSVSTTYPKRNNK
jgi:hypothetical protein